MIRRGDIVTVRTHISRRRTKAVVQYVNYRYGWYTALVKTPFGEKYLESFWIRDVEDKEEQENRKKPKGKRCWEEEDDPYNWLDEWSEGKVNG